MLVIVPEKFLLKNIIIDKDHLYKTGAMEIDDCIVEEIKDLWRMGVHTRSCCCGHGGPGGNIVVERTDIPKMLELGYEPCNTGREIYYNIFKPKSKCYCEHSENNNDEVVWEWPRLD